MSGCWCNKLSAQTRTPKAVGGNYSTFAENILNFSEKCHTAIKIATYNNCNRIYVA
jgi:hypothetical protein